jgi:hypothetical protein
MQELSVIIRQKQYAKQVTNKRLLSNMYIYIYIND